MALILIFLFTYLIRLSETCQLLEELSGPKASCRYSVDPSGSRICLPPPIEPHAPCLPPQFSNPAYVTGLNYDLYGSLHINSRLLARLNNQLSHPILSMMSLHSHLKCLITEGLIELKIIVCCYVIIHVMIENKAMRCTNQLPKNRKQLLQCYH